jgi:fumarate hydratase class II
MAKTRTETDSFGPIDVPADDLTSIKVDVRQVRQFVRDDNRIDDRGAIEGEGLVARFL